MYTYIPTGEKYIGQTKNLKKRKQEHLNETRTNKRFHNLLQKYPNKFKIEIIEDNIKDEELNEKEKYWIKYYNTFSDFGFNLTEGGDGGFSYCQKYWKDNPDKLKEHIKKVQPLASAAAKQWRKENPELEKLRIENLHKKSQEWRENNPELFQQNLKKAQEAAKKWRKDNPELFQESLKRAQEKNCKKVILINTGEIFSSASEAGRIYKIPASNISACCRKVRKSAGKDKEGKKLIWEYI